MAVKQITEITCDVCKRKMPERYGVSIETGESPPCVESPRPTHEIDLCHKCACEALQEGIDKESHNYIRRERYGLIMAKYFPKVKRID